MLKLFSDLSIRIKLYVVAMAISLLLALLSYFSFTSFERVKNLYGVLDHVQESESSLLMLRNNEKDFLTRKKLTYQVKFKKNTQHLMAELGELEDFLTKESPNERALITLIIKEFDEYVDDFNEIVEFNQRIGLSENKGLRGKLRDAVHAAEAQVSSLHEHILLADLLMLRRHEKDFMLRKSTKYIDKFERSFKVFKQHLNEKNLDKSRLSTAHTDVITPAMMENIKAQMNVYRAGFITMSGAYKTMGLTSHEGLHGSMRSKVEQVERHIDTFEAYLDDKVTSLIFSAKQTGIAIGLVIMALIVFILLFIFHSINTRLRIFIEHMQKITRGEIGLKAQSHIHSKGELGKMNEAFNRMINKLLLAGEDKKLALWLSEGSTLMANAMRGVQERQGLAKNVIDTLVGYLDVSAASLYLLKEEQLLLLLCHGLAEEDRPSESIELGDGLIGQVAQDKKTMQLDAVPQGFLTLRSSLGASSPASVLIYPVTYNHTTVAVIELAWLGDRSEHAKRFMDKVVDSIALSFIACGQREHSQLLLKESQTQAEELQAQSEELRVTNDSLIERTDALKQKQSYLEKARQETEEKAKDLAQASHYKSEFLANMSHELRTPLNSLLILAKSLADNDEGNLSADDVESAQVIRESGHHLLELINDILDLSKVEAGKMSLHLDALSITALADSMVSRFKHMAEDKSIVFEVTFASTFPETIKTDAGKAGQILTNLISNAIKFTNKGKVILDISLQCDSPVLQEQGDAVVFAVQDSGIGISKEKQKAVFEAFQQADGTTSRTHGGTGLGLSIAKRFAQFLGGDIRMESDLGKGSTFSLYLPVSIPSWPEDNAVDIGTVMPSRVDVGNKEVSLLSAFTDDREHLDPDKSLMLVIEDDKPFAKILLDACHQQQCQAIIAGDGEVGLILASEYPCDGIILDYMLPNLNGGEVLKRIKSNPSTRHIPVHIISALDNIGDMRKLGAIGHANKPIAYDDIIGLIAELSLHAKLNRVDDSAEGLKLLVVEDDATALFAEEKLLHKQNIETQGARSATAALQYLREEMFDVVILDLGLPDMSGFEFLEVAAVDAAIHLPPVIVYSGAEIDREAQERLSPFTDNIIMKSMHSAERLLDEVQLFARKITVQRSEAQRLSERDSSVIQSIDVDFQKSVVLLVDDDMRNTFALAKVLRKQGLTVRLASSGQQSLDMLQEHADINLVLMDIMMPEMDGYEAMQRIRQQEKFKDLALIALTANAMTGDKEKCLEAGANDYLSKPVDVGQLLTMLKVWL